jgi:GT2 family glycosyltransferase
VTRARQLVHFVVPFRVRRALGVTLFRARHEWFRGRSAEAAAQAQLPPPLPTVPSDLPSERLSFPRCNDPLVSIVIPAHNYWAHTHLCLRAVLEHTAGPSYEVILADDASTDETTGAADLLRNVTIIRSETQLGFVTNCNHAARHAHGQYLLLLNNDTVVQPGWLEELVATADRELDAGVVGGKVLDEEGYVQEAGCVIFADGSAAQFGRGQHPVDPACNYVKDVDYVSGCCLLIRRDLWNRLGGFDEEFSPGYYEDVDLAFRVRQAGHRVVYQPRALVVHSEGVSHGRDPDAGIKRYLGINAEKFRERWQDVLEREQLDPADLHLARDRSTRRKRVLVVDHEVPQPDRDAGSRFVATYIELMVELGHQVVFVSDSGGPVEPYATDLQQAGVEVVWGVQGSEARSEWFRANGRYFDFAYLHRPFVATRYLDALREHSSATVIYSPVDIHYLRERRRWSVTGDVGADEQALAFERDELRLLHGADVVHVVSAYEEELVRELVPGAIVRTLPIYAYDEPYVDAPGYESRRHVMFVGGFMHLPNVDGARWFVDEVFPLVRERVPDAFALLVGSHPPPELHDLAGDGVIVTGRVSERMLEDLYRQTRLVVCPLRYGAGAKGKLVEALYYGVPAVVTPIAAEGLPDIDEHVIVAAPDPAEFADRVVELYTDPDLWERYAQGGDYAATHFSRQAALAVLRRDLLPEHEQASEAAPALLVSDRAAVGE